eukprot:TRINITY_DN60509_c0_g1_i1.p1 TRINITY_DN60509_c0_g1~~TRINITY_DN60509_c0_g1_i1.p1  ORF type:complete len:441 (-),score=95.27 TRINITY_DN60509_c0_g1_i1:134-1393(-)
MAVMVPLRRLAGGSADSLERAKFRWPAAAGLRLLAVVAVAVSVGGSSGAWLPATASQRRPQWGTRSFCQRHGAYDSRGLSHRVARASKVRAESWPKTIQTKTGTVELPGTLPEATEDILRRLRERRPQRHDRVHSHELPTLVMKPVWTNLGILSKKQEEHHGALPSDKWVSLRLDGCAWGTLMKQLKKLELLPMGFSDDIAEAMQATCKAVMQEFGAVLGYTHSDELTVLLPPGTRKYDGSMNTWVSVAASVASGVFNRKLGLLAQKHQVALDDVMLATFDCRVGVFDSAGEAWALVLWRVNDCNVNSASDAIKFTDAPNSVRSFNTIEKLLYLQERDMLPLQRHQAHGSLFTRAAAGNIVLVNTGDAGAPKHVLNLARLGLVLPEYFGTPADLPEWTVPEEHMEEAKKVEDQLELSSS